MTSAQMSALRTRQVLEDVYDERLSQEYLKSLGRFTHSCADVELSDFECLAILGEEFGEVAREMLSRAGMVVDGANDLAALRKETVQLAAVAVALVERLDKVRALEVAA